MKPAPFLYKSASSPAQACELLHQYGDEAKILAGGQSLVPFMNFRLAVPGVLVDINPIAELDYIEILNGTLRIGALTRHHTLETYTERGPLVRLLPRVARHIAHLPIRMRGTFAGSLAHADPASEWCTLATAFDAQIKIQGPGGERVEAASAFFLAPFTTMLGETDLICEVQLPHLGQNWHCGFAEASRRAGDFALIAAVAAIEVSDGRISKARLGIGGAAGRPVQATAAQEVLLGEEPGPVAWNGAAEAAASEIDTITDMHADAAFRRDLVRAMTRRALNDAWPMEGNRGN